MKILDTLLQELPAETIPVKTVLVGIHSILVESKNCGLAATILPTGPHGESAIRQVGELEKKTAQELAQWVHSDNPLEAGIGLAAINSLLDIDKTRITEVNARDLLITHGKNKNIAVIGHFPFLSAIRQTAQNLQVFELNPSEGEFPSEKASEWLPGADIVAITSSTLINHTLDDLLKMCRPETWVMLIGPSTPLTPSLFRHGISVLSGTLVFDSESAVHTISQGATSYRQIQGIRMANLVAQLPPI